MKEDFNLSPGPSHRRERDEAKGRIHIELPASPAGSGAKSHANGHAAASKSMDMWVVLDLLAHRWIWLLMGSSIFAAGFFYLGWHMIKPKFTASASLLRYETALWKDYQPTPMSSETFASLMRSPDLLVRVGTNVS